MTDTVEVALIVAGASLVTSLPTLLVALKGLRVGKSNHELANSKLTNVENQLGVALGRIGQLEAMLTAERGGRRRN